jgi:hypothetical protein
MCIIYTVFAYSMYSMQIPYITYSNKARTTETRVCRNSYCSYAGTDRGTATVGMKGTDRGTATVGMKGTDRGTATAGMKKPVGEHLHLV